MNQTIEARLAELTYQLARLEEATKLGLLRLETDIEKLEEFASSTDYEVEQLTKKVSTFEDELEDFKYGNDYVTSDDLTNVCNELEDKINILEVEINDLQKD